ncbi:MAG TPA: VOC family protein [Candidatus Limnocylindrales bacterium]
MLRGIDHLVIACPDLDAGVAALTEHLGLAVAGGGRHVALGTENRLVWLGDAYLELIAVVDASLAAASWIGPSVLAALERGGGLATWAIASDDLDRDVASLRAAGSGLGQPTAGERTRPDDEVVRWRLALPGPLGPDRSPFLIEHEPSGAEWGPGARAGRAAEVHPVGGAARLHRLELAVADPAAVANRLRRDTGLAFGPPGAGIVEAELVEQTVRLLPAGHDRPAAGIVIGISSGRPRSADLLGCRFTLQLAEG